MGKHAGMAETLHDFQIKKVENTQCIVNLNYESERCWVNLAE
jgi:hypothetical protein